ncbi:hypothetical protein GCM10023231_21990 [Olivibacter ginsenosidimutans]|uniref:Outer membrane protein beta-barrel domain-containing protein n=1 Tax=Olivibacter ginsenosidimutans TaxID=1176537 RepID=A0ABP9BC56_9SPHI
MKKFILLSILVGFFHQQLSAQSWKYQYGIKLGASVPGYRLSNVSTGTTREASNTLGFSVTGTAEASPSRYFAIQSGLSFQLLGAQLNYSEFGKTNVRQRTFWLQVPLNVMAKLPLKDSSNFFIAAGPYGGLGLMGANNFDDSFTGTRTDFTFGSNGSQKRFDYGVNLNIGYQVKRGYNIAIGYMMGIADLSTSTRYQQRNRAWTVNVGYSF